MSESRPEFMALPFYGVCDTSWSMQGGGIDGLNRAVPAMRDVLRADALAKDVVKTSFIAFSDAARVVLPLSDLVEAHVPQFTAQGGTNYHAALELLAQTMQNDIQKLSEQRLGIYRPVVFYLSDGGPNKAGWESLIPTLPYSPLIVPVGIGSVTEGPLEQLRTPKDRSKLYIIPDGDPEAIASAIAEMAKFMMMSVVRSAGGAPMNLPTPGQLETNVIVYDYDGTVAS